MSVLIDNSLVQNKDVGGEDVKSHSTFSALLAQCQQIREQCKEGMGSLLESTSPKSEDVTAVLAQMVGELGDLQVTIARSGGLLNDYNRAVGESMVTQAQSAMKRVMDELKASGSQEQHLSFWQKFAHVVMIVVAVVGVVAGVLSGDPVLAVASVVSLIDSQTHFTEKAAEGIGSVFHSPVVGAIIVTTLMVCITAGAAAATAPASIAEGVEEGVSEGVEDAGSGAAGSSGRTAAVADGARVRGFTAMSFLENIESTGLVNRVIEGFVSLSKLSDEKKKEVEMIIEGVVSLVIAALGAVSAWRLNSIIQGSSLLARFGSLSTRLCSGLQKGQFAFTLVQTTAQGLQAEIGFRLAETQKLLGRDQGLVGLFESLMQATNLIRQNNEKNLTSMLEMSTQGLDALLQDLPAAGRATAQVLAHSAA